MSVKKTFSKGKSLGYKKIRSRALDEYAGLSRNNILMVTLNDAAFRNFMMKFANKAGPRPVTTTEISYHQIYTPFFILISSSLTEETFVTETFARSKNLRDSWIIFLRILNCKIKKISGNPLSNEKKQEYMFIK